MINGRRTITFPRTAGQQDGEHLELSLSSIQGRPFTVAIVEKRKDGMDFGSWMLGGTVDDPSHDCLPHQDSMNRGRILQIGYAAPWEKRASTWGHGCGIMLDETLAGPPNPFAPTLTTLWIVTRTADSNLSLYLNGGKAGATAGEGLLPAGATPLIGFIGRGFQPLPVDSRFRGELGEVVIYDVALDDGQRRVLESHLGLRWDFKKAN
jgi:hypothetical protein